MENKIEIREKSTLFSVQFEIEHKEQSIAYPPYAKYDNDIKPMLIEYRHICILALTMRMQHCMQSLMRHQNNVVKADEDIIIYTKDDGSLTHFSVPAYESMRFLKEYLTKNEVNTHSAFFHLSIIQLVKALYWIPEKPKDFGKLISCLVDYLATGGYEK